jgi:hypothetical protein
MTELQERVADYLASQATVGPHVRAAQNAYGWLTPPPLPPAQTLANEFLADTEFRAIQLGTWLNTTEGQIIADAVARVLAPGYQPMFSIIVEALQIAAARQTGRSRRSAVALAAVSFLVYLTFGKG